MVFFRANCIAPHLCGALSWRKDGALRVFAGAAVGAEEQLKRKKNCSKLFFTGFSSGCPALWAIFLGMGCGGLALGFPPHPNPLPEGEGTVPRLPAGTVQLLAPFCPLSPWERAGVREPQRWMVGAVSCHPAASIWPFSSRLMCQAIASRRMCGVWPPRAQAASK
ncbi:hypothetical protein D3C78_772490 [compost metagenome]